MNNNTENKICISIIVCAHNEEKILDKCIQSLYEQSFQKSRFEIIVVDDESTDKTSKIALNWTKTHTKDSPQFTYARIEHGALSVARNTGVMLARGRIVAFIDGDALADKNWVKNLVKRFSSSEKPLIIGGKVNLLNPESEFATLIYNSFFSYNMKNKNIAIGTNMAFTKSLFKEKHPFHPLFLRRGDETFLFKKLESSITPIRESSAEVFHECPESPKEWLKSKYDNGYFGAQIELVYGNLKGLFKTTTYRAMFMVMPALIALSLVLSSKSTLLISSIAYGILITNRYLRKGTVFDLLKHYRKMRGPDTKPHAREALKLLVFCIIGDYYNDFGCCHRLLEYVLSKDTFEGQNEKDAIITTLQQNFTTAIH